MTRDEARQRLWELVFGDPSPEDARDLEEAVRGDPDLAREVAALREIARAGRSLPAPPMPRAVRRRILRAAREEARRITVPGSWRRWLAWSPAAMAAVATLVVAVVGSHLWQRQEEALSVRGPEGPPAVPAREAERQAPGEEVPRGNGFAPAEKEARPPVPTEPVPVREAGRVVETPVEPGPRAESRTASRRAEPTRERIGQPPPTPTDASASRARGPGGTPERLGTSSGMAGGGGVSPSLSEGTPAGIGSPAAGRGPPARTAARALEPMGRPTPMSADSRESEVSGVPGDRSRCPTRVRESSRQGRLQEALQEARACLRTDLSPEDLLETLELAARLAWELGHREEAREHLRRLWTLPGGEDRARDLPVP